jgi:hypothetical protein
MMQVIDRKRVGNEEREHTAEDAEGAEARKDRGPELTQEQREWLNKVFIPNFRAELIRTLRPEDLVPNNGRRGRETKSKASRKQSGDDPASLKLRRTVTPPRQPAETPALRSSKADASRPDDAGNESARMAEMEGEITRLRGVLAETRVDRELVWAAASQHAINPAQVAHLMKDRVRLDNDLEPVVMNAQGDRQFDRYGRPVAVADAVGTFLEKNPHMVRPSTELAGGGSGGTDATVRAPRIAAVTGGDLIEEALREGE